MHADEQRERDDQRHREDSTHPTAQAPDSVATSVPGAGEWVGKTGPDAADPPRAAGKHGYEGDGDPELDPDEGADAFETGEEARAEEREDGPRRDEDQITIDPPD